MWMVNPRKMCVKHLCGEHVELHMLVGSLNRGRSVAGFLEKGLLEPKSIRLRHYDLVQEMERRGYSHGSPLPEISLPLPRGKVNRVKSRAELRRRCPNCKEMGL